MHLLMYKLQQQFIIFCEKKNSPLDPLQFNTIKNRFFLI